MPKTEPNAFLIKFRMALGHSGIKISSYAAVAFAEKNKQENNTSDENLSVILMLCPPEDVILTHYETLYC